MDLSQLFKGQKLKMKCPACETSFDAPAEKVMKEGSVIDCPGCNKGITISHDDASFKELKKSLDELKKMFR
ncbi:hypothetical protein JJB07_14775 [Tumebacillus sp. ITR2]|uniref:Transcription factor zinc-finger domain-containing protein n=1 Tax=Tumebacillus amylolyticus TaxID=2801339 RepID=A0ABS1JCA1_9BACL|nr:hypothetical protein [Tumebacillus amylolyticus]MBL0387902.1 hypothetical protein [Tumebacillus amylolyticus]